MSSHLYLFVAAALISAASNAATPLSDSELERRTDCMVSLSSPSSEDHQELIAVVRAPGGMPIGVEGGGHICKPYSSGVVEEVQMRGTTKLQALMGFCGLRLGAIAQSDTQHAMQSFYQKMIDRNASFKLIFQRADAAKQLCP